MTWITGTCVFKLTQKSGASFGTYASERANAIDANTVRSTGSGGTIVNVDRTIRTSPTIHADTIVASVCVDATGPILTWIRFGGTLVHVLRTKRSGKVGRTFTMIKSSGLRRNGLKIKNNANDAFKK